MNADDLIDGRLVRMYCDTRSQFGRHVISRSMSAADEGRKARDAIAGIDDLHLRQRLIRDGFISSIGGPVSGFDPEHVELRGRIDCDGFCIEKILARMCGGVYLSGSVYVPDGVDAPRGAVLYLCGHNPLGKGAPSFQRACRRLAQAGLVVLAIDPIGQGERAQCYDCDRGCHVVDPGVREHDHVGSQCIPVGDGLARYFLRDAMCGISILQRRCDVDPKQIGVCGYSGGGTQTAMLMMADDRVAAAAPGVFISDRTSYLLCGGCQDAEQVWFGAASWGFDHADILLSMAPRPVLVLSAKWDFFPIEGTRKSIRCAEAVLARCGMPPSIEFFEEAAEHACTDAMAVAAAGFFARQFSSPGRVDGPDPGFLPAEALWCTPTGCVVAEFPRSPIVHEENVMRWNERMSRVVIVDEFVSWLSVQVGRERLGCGHGLRLLGRDGDFSGLRFELGLWWSQEGVANAGALFRDRRFDGQVLPVTVGFWEGGTCKVSRHADWIRSECASGRAVLVLDPTGSGACASNPVNPYGYDAFYGTIQWMNDALMWLGDSLAAMRAYDANRCLAVLADWPGVEVEGVSGRAVGRFGYPLLMAAVLDPRWVRIDADGVPSMGDFVSERYYDSRSIREFVMPGLLRFADRDDLMSIINGGAR